MAEQTIIFSKMNGIGNEIIVMDLRDEVVNITASSVNALAHYKKLHFDQLMVLKKARSEDTTAFVEIWNQDGSRANACGNGMRCIAALEFEKYNKDRIKFETSAGILEAFRGKDDKITVDMGTPKFNWAEIPLQWPQSNTTAIDLSYPNTGDPVLQKPSVVNVGNPHVIFWVENIDNYDLGKIGPEIEQHPFFPEGVNISLVEINSPKHITLKVWERGAGLTKACGSAACAATVAAARLEKSLREVTVTLPGGALQIQWCENNHILMTGPWELEYQDRLPKSFLL